MSTLERIFDDCVKKPFGRYATQEKMTFYTVVEFTNREDLLAVYELDFEPIHQQLRCLYSNRPRHLPHDPQVLLRSLLLMTVFGVTSIPHGPNVSGANRCWRSLPELQ